MKKYILFLAAVFVLTAAATIKSEDASMESVRAANDLSLKTAAAALPITLQGKAANLRCDARLRFQSGGFHNNCPYGRVMTGVQVLENNIAVLTCAEISVTCR